MEDYEDYYLINEEFTYPDSLPFNMYPLEEYPRKHHIEILFLEKYVKDIKEENKGDKVHIIEY